MATLVSPFGTGTIEERHQARLQSEAAKADVSNKTQSIVNTADEEIMVSIVSDLRAVRSFDHDENKVVTKYYPIFETTINIGRDEAYNDILDGISALYFNEDLTNRDKIESFSRSFILTRQNDGRYIKSDLSLYIRKNMLNHGLICEGETEGEMLLDDIFNDLIGISADVSNENIDEPDINDCRDVTMDGFNLPNGFNL